MPTAPTIDQADAALGKLYRFYENFELTRRDLDISAQNTVWIEFFRNEVERYADDLSKIYNYGHDGELFFEFLEAMENPKALPNVPLAGPPALKKRTHKRLLANLS